MIIKAISTSFENLGLEVESTISEEPQATSLITPVISSHSPNIRQNDSIIYSPQKFEIEEPKLQDSRDLHMKSFNHEVLASVPLMVGSNSGSDEDPELNAHEKSNFLVEIYKLHSTVLDPLSGVCENATDAPLHFPLCVPLNLGLKVKNFKYTEKLLLNGRPPPVRQIVCLSSIHFLLSQLIVHQINLRPLSHYSLETNYLSASAPLCSNYYMVHPQWVENMNIKEICSDEDKGEDNFTYNDDRFETPAKENLHQISHCDSHTAEIQAFHSLQALKIISLMFVESFDSLQSSTVCLQNTRPSAIFVGVEPVGASFKLDGEIMVVDKVSLEIWDQGHEPYGDPGLVMESYYYTIITLVNHGQGFKADFAQVVLDDEQESLWKGGSLQEFADVQVQRLYSFPCTHEKFWKKLLMFEVSLHTQKWKILLLILISCQIEEISGLSQCCRGSEGA